MTLKNVVVVSTLMLLLCGFSDGGNGESAKGASAAPIPYDAPVKSKIDDIFQTLSGELHEADDLVKLLRSRSALKEPDAQAELSGAAEKLSALADRLEPNGELAQQLAALRNAAMVHEKHVQDLASGLIEETDRTAVLGAWKQVIEETDKAQIAMRDMRNALINVLHQLRIRQTAISELLMADEYKAAVQSFRQWLSNLEKTVKELHKAIDSNAAPTS